MTMILVIREYQPHLGWLFCLFFFMLIFLLMVVEWPLKQFNVAKIAGFFLNVKVGFFLIRILM